MLSSLYQTYDNLLFKDVSHGLSPAKLQCVIFEMSLPEIICPPRSVFTLRCILCLLGMGSYQRDVLRTSLGTWSQVRWIAFFFFSLSSAELTWAADSRQRLFFFLLFQLTGSQAKLARTILFWMTHGPVYEQTRDTPSGPRLGVCVYLKKMYIAYPETLRSSVTEIRMERIN